MHKKTERSAICRIHESQKAAEEIYRGSALEEAMIELVAIKGEGWLEVFRDKLVSRCAITSLEAIKRLMVFPSAVHRRRRASDSR